MKTIETMLHQLTDAKTVMQDVQDTLRIIDPEFQAEEDNYLKAVKDLERELGDTISPSVSEYLGAKEAEFAAAIIYIGWQGFQFNLDIFQNPVNALLLNGDYEDLHRERRLGTLPDVKRAQVVIEAFDAEVKKLPEEKRNLTDGITEFYTYLETTGYKVAHYFGFRLADRFLPYVIPGYSRDDTITFQYAGGLKDFLKIDLDRME